MRTLRKNRQKMFYSLYDATTPVYEKDDDGNIIYDEIDGVQVPRETGTCETSYGKPVEFKANIHSELNEMHLKSYGVDQSSIYSEIVVEKGKLPFQIGAIVWRESEIIYEDNEKTIPKQSSADYTVVGIMTEGLSEDCYLLQRKSSEDE